MKLRKSISNLSTPNRHGTKSFQILQLYCAQHIYANCINPTERIQYFRREQGQVRDAYINAFNDSI